jgi:hypothetical protein
MMRYALPGLGNVWMVLIKATALISVIQLPELMRSADIAARNTRKAIYLLFCGIPDLPGDYHHIDHHAAMGRKKSQQGRKERISRSWKSSSKACPAC